MPEFTLKVSIQIISYYLDGMGNSRNKNEHEKRNMVHFAKLRTIFQSIEKNHVYLITPPTNSTYSEICNCFTLFLVCFDFFNKMLL